jgi:hypothetical protein
MMNRLRMTALKFIYGLFILWVGLLSPLVYFDLFAVNHFVQPYHFISFKPAVKKETSPPETVFPQLKQKLLHRFKSQQSFINASSPAAGPSHLFQWATSQLSLIALTYSALLLLFGHLSLNGQPAVTSADLPPPDKPPQLILTPA